MNVDRQRSLNEIKDLLPLIENEIQALCGVIFKFTVGGNEYKLFSNGMRYNGMIERIVVVG